MILCSDDCIPCCDFCIHAKHSEWDDERGHHTGGPDKCLLYNDEVHNDIAIFCGYCDDYHCFMAENKTQI